MTNCNMKTVGNLIILNKIIWDHGKWELDHKLNSNIPQWQCMEIQVSQKRFPTKTLLKLIDSSVENLREVEYDYQNSLKPQKIQVRSQNSKY
jgi:hypothetical protein